MIGTFSHTYTHTHKQEETSGEKRIMRLRRVKREEALVLPHSDPSLSPSSHLPSPGAWCPPLRLSFQTPSVVPDAPESLPSNGTTRVVIDSFCVAWWNVTPGLILRWLHWHIHEYAVMITWMTILTLSSNTNQPLFEILPAMNNVTCAPNKKRSF